VEPTDGFVAGLAVEPTAVVVLSPQFEPDPDWVVEGLVVEHERFGTSGEFEHFELVEHWLFRIPIDEADAEPSLPPPHLSSLD